MSAGTWFASGGLCYDGSDQCRLDEAELERVALEIAQSEAQAVVVSGTFSPSDPSQEERAAQILRKFLPPGTRVTISSEHGQLGLLARENSAVLNACLYKAGIPSSARLYFTANDGSVIFFQQAAESPLRCVACGPTNSLRGAAFLVSAADNTHCSGEGSPFSADRIVLDIGGTSTDAGCLVNGIHPRDSNSIALGGGSIVATRVSVLT